MFVFLIYTVILHQVHSVCNQPEICPDNPVVKAEIVDVHNTFRRAVQPSAANMVLMRYNQDLAASAQAWVDRCILDHGEPSTRMFNGYELGENLYYSMYPNSWVDVINAWNSEKSRYLYPNGSMDGRAVGHYTQVVWSTSYEVGCGAARCPNDLYFYGCHYYRAGNFAGVPPYKAGASCASCPDHCADKLCTNPCPYINRFTNCATMKTIAGCSNGLVSSWCPASCLCPTEIIPVG